MKTVSEVFGESSEIDLSQTTISNGKDFSENDVCIIGMPSYGGRVPAVALERMAEYRGNGAKAIIIVSYGNRDYDDTLKELQDFVIKKGFSCIAAISAVENILLCTNLQQEDQMKKIKKRLSLMQKKLQRN